MKCSDRTGSPSSEILKAIGNMVQLQSWLHFEWGKGFRPDEVLKTPSKLNYCIIYNIVTRAKFREEPKPHDEIQFGFGGI